MITSWVGEQLAVWCAKDTLAPYLAEGEVTHARLKDWLRRRFGNRMYRMGCEPLDRQRGLRSEVERTASRMAGQGGHVMGSAAIKSGGWEVSTEYDDDDLVSYSVIDRSGTPEDALLHKNETEVALAEARRLVAATFRDAGPRYQRIFEYLFVDGFDRVKIAEIEGCSKNRASQLSTRVRNAVRTGGITRSDAGRLLKYISGQQNSAVWENIKADLRIDKPRMNRAMAYLISTGIEIESEQDVAGRSNYTIAKR
jgi:DNA-directed RNA polymerase specialized sigma24 family protein